MTGAHPLSDSLPGRKKLHVSHHGRHFVAGCRGRLLERALTGTATAPRPGRHGLVTLPGRAVGTEILLTARLPRGCAYAVGPAAGGPSIRSSAMLPRWLKLGETTPPGLLRVEGCRPDRSAWRHRSRPCSFAW